MKLKISACCGLLSKRKEDVYELSPNPSRKEEMKSLLLAKLEKNAEKKERFSQIIGRNGVLERESSKLRRAVSHEYVSTLFLISEINSKNLLLSNYRALPVTRRLRNSEHFVVQLLSYTLKENFCL